MKRIRTFGRIPSQLARYVFASARLNDDDGFVCDAGRQGLDFTTPIIDTAAIRAVSKARDTAMVEHLPLKCLASSVKTHGCIVDRDAQSLSGLFECRIAHIDEFKNRRVAGTHILGLADAAATQRREFRVGAFREGGRNVDQTQLRRAPAHCVHNDVAVHPVEPGQHASRVFKRFCSFDGPHSSHLNDVFDFVWPDPRPNERRERRSVLTKCRRDDRGFTQTFVRSGHNRDFSLFLVCRTSAGGLTRTVRAAGAAFPTTATRIGWGVLLARAGRWAVFTRAFLSVGHNHLLLAPKKERPIYTDGRGGDILTPGPQKRSHPRLYRSEKPNIGHPQAWYARLRLDGRERQVRV